MLWPSRRTTIVCTLASLLAFGILFLGSPAHTTHRSAHQLLRSYSQDVRASSDGQELFAESTPSTWTFDSERHARNYGLSSERCRVAFPDFFYEIDRARQFWHGRGGINEDHLHMDWQKESGMLRLSIEDQQLIVVETKWAVPAYDVTRALALLHSINRAIITSPEPVPDVEFTINVGDWPNDPSNSHPVWVLSRAAVDTAKWVMPDFGYWSWPVDVLGEYNEIRRRIHITEPRWDKKHNQAVWRGATATNPLRDALVSASAGKDWSDIKAVEWQGGMPVISDGSGRALTAPEHCLYKYVVHTEGHSYSGRGKYLLNCNSVSIVHEQEWIEPHSHLYQSSGPEQNIIAVQRDFADLDSVMQILSNDTEAQRIATNSIATFRDRYLTPAAQTCYWRQLISAWAEVSQFTPKPHIILQKPSHHGFEKERRGVSYESFVADLAENHV